jgi:uracil-DNA glycosylase
VFKLDPSWKAVLEDPFTLPHMVELQAFLKAEADAGKKIYPAPKDIFTALDACPFEQVKVVILGQDPYHGPGQAHGLCFSVQKGVAIPPSLMNIYKELATDVDVTPPAHGNLISWAQQGVLLLNNVLTVEDGKAGSHHKRGWELFTDHIVEVLNEKKENLVFILWGSPAQKKAAKVDAYKHLLLKSVHPSPLSSYRGFFGSKPFSQTNSYLKKHGIAPINWSL